MHLISSSEDRNNSLLINDSVKTHTAHANTKYISYHCYGDDSKEVTFTSQ